MPLHSFQLDNPLPDRSHDIVVQTLVTIHSFVYHVFDDLVIDLERLRDLFEQVVEVLNMGVSDVC